MRERALGVQHFSTKTQLLETSQDTPTNEGLVVHLDGAHAAMHVQ